MKKIISLIIALLFSVSALSLTAFADVPDGVDVYYEENETLLDKTTAFSFSEDLKTLYFGKEKYVRFSDDKLSTTADYELKNPINLPDSQKEIIKEINLMSNYEGDLIYAEIYYKDGANLYSTYISEETYNEYETVIKDKNANLTINFNYPEDNIVKVSKSKIYSSEKTNIKFDYLNLGLECTVSIYNKSESIEIVLGLLYFDNKDCYYIDFDENNANYYNYDFTDKKEISAYKITDPALLEELKAAEKKFYSNEFNYFFDTDFTKLVSNIIIIAIFAVLPFACLVVFTIFAIKSKNIYRKFCITTAAASAAELIVFAIITLLII